MNTTYVLIDYENVQPEDLALLNGHPFKVVVFLGANQTKVSSTFAAALQARGHNGEYVRIQGNGRNALDFHIAFHLGELASSDRTASFHVISRDTGFDPLIAHMRTRGVEARRSSTLADVVPADDGKLNAVIEHLGRMAHPPVRSKKLMSTINALFEKKLEAGQVEALIEALAARGIVSVKDGKVGYPSPN